MREGYHNYHHEFQHDYRNGVKPWNFDPTKWIIWALSKLGLTRNLRRVPVEKIRLAQQLNTDQVEKYRRWSYSTHRGNWAIPVIAETHY
jgi:stearoyl-CoA desaturase (delta-9 desaturase)